MPNSRIYKETNKTIKVPMALIVFPDGSHQKISDNTLPYSKVCINYPGEIFLCNSDFLIFGGVYNELEAEEYLEIGQLYFALPKNMLLKKIQTKEMQILANRAHLAMSEIKAILVRTENTGVTFMEIKGE